MVDLVEMLKYKYNEEKVTFEISAEKQVFRNPELLDLIKKKSA